MWCTRDCMRYNIFIIVKKTERRKDRIDVCSWVFEFQILKWLEHVFNKDNVDKSLILRGKLWLLKIGLFWIRIGEIK